MQSTPQLISLKTMRLIYCVALAFVLDIAWVHSQSYLNFKGTDIDSDEHGQSEGQKTTNCSCGWTNKARIIGGRETLKNEFPLMAGIMDMKDSHLFAGATIITENHALTAAHVTYRNKTTVRLALVVGAHNVSATDDDVADVIPILKSIEHELFSNKSYHYDIAIVVLSRSIKFNQYIGPACLPTQKLSLTYEYVKVLGWGRLAVKEKTSSVLMKVNLRVVPTAECAKQFMRKIPVDNAFQICTYLRKKDSCQGDSGGPVLWLDPETNRYTQVGIVSWGKICAYKTPSINTDVSHHMQWIQATIAATGVPGKTCSKVD